MTAAATFAFAAGLIAPLNPCGFAMLPGFLSLYLGAEEDAGGSLLGRVGRGFRVGLALTAGFAAVFVVAGLVISAGLRSFVHVIPWLAVVIAALLVLLGLAMLAGASIGLTPASRIAVGAPAAGYGRVLAFGAGYALASLSCTLAVFLIVVGQATAAANPVRVLAVLAAYAAGAATVLVSLSLSAALAKAALARAARRLAPLVGRIAGLLLAASGAYLILYWLPTLRGGRSATPAVVDQVLGVSTRIEAFLSAHTAPFVAALAGLAILGAVILPATARTGGAEPGGEAASAPEPCCEPGAEALDRAGARGELLEGAGR